MFKKITQTATGLNDLHATVSDAMREYEETQRQLGDKADSAADSFVGKAILGVVVAIMALAVIAVQFPSATQLFPPLFGAFFVLIGVGGFMSFRKKPKSARRWYEAAVLAFALVGGIVFCASIGLTAAGFDLDAAVNSLGSWESDGSYVNRPLCLVAGLFFASVGIVGAATIGNSPKRRRRDVEERLTLTVEGTVVEPPVIYVTVNGVRQPLRSAAAVHLQIEPAAHAKRLGALRGLEILGHIRVHVAFAVEHRVLFDVAVGREARQHDVLDSRLVRHGKRARHPQAHGAGVRVGFGAEFQLAATKHLRRKLG